MVHIWRFPWSGSVPIYFFFSYRIIECNTMLIKSVQAPAQVEMNYTN